MLKSAGGLTAGRVTGLDPAGPRFVDGPVLPAIPELAAELLDTQSAAFVDIVRFTQDTQYTDPTFGRSTPTAGGSQPQ